MRDGVETRVVRFPRAPRGEETSWRGRLRRLPEGPQSEGPYLRRGALAAVREAVAEAARRRLDVVVPRSAVRVAIEEDRPVLTARLPEPVDGREEVRGWLTHWAAAQLARRAAIPEGYARRLLIHAPDLWASSVNRCLELPQPGFVGRPLDPLLLRLRKPRKDEGSPAVRAVLSARYRILDNLEVLDELGETLERWERAAEVLDAETDGDALWVRLTWPRLACEVRVGDVVRVGVAIHNSEIGDGALEVRPLLLRLACSNGMVVPQRLPGLRRVHRGPRRPPGRCRPEPRPFAGLETGRVHAAILAVTETEELDEYLAAVGEAARTPIPHPVPALARLVERRLLTSPERARVVRRVEAHPGGLTLWEFANAITATARELPPARRWALERLGGEVVAPGALRELVLDP